jgi:hypothetical protein
MDNPTKPNFWSLATNKIVKIKSNPKELFDIPKLLISYFVELKHQRRFIANYLDDLKGTHSSRRINSIINKRNLKMIRYLEIGVAHGYTFQAIKSDFKIGVDPFPKSRIKNSLENFKIIPKTSDNFFESNKQKFDLIFVDGMHTFKQTYSDLLNSLNSLAPGGVLLVDDVLPGDRFSAMPDINQCRRDRIIAGEELETWSGDVFKSIIALKELHPNLEIATIITPDHPQSLIWKNQLDSETFNLAQDSEGFHRFSDIVYEDFFADLFEINRIFNFQLEWNAINQYLKIAPQN